MGHTKRCNDVRKRVNLGEAQGSWGTEQGPGLRVSAQGGIAQTLNPVAGREEGGFPLGP